MKTICKVQNFILQIQVTNFVTHINNISYYWQQTLLFIVTIFITNILTIE